MTPVLGVCSAGVARFSRQPARRDILDTAVSNFPKDVSMQRNGLQPLGGALPFKSDLLFVSGVTPVLGVYSL